MIPATTTSDDDLPVVLLDDKAEVAALSADPSAPDTAASLTPASAKYLASQGITDPAIWAAFRLDAVDATALARLLTPAQGRHVRPNGLWLPTCDPRSFDAIVGLIRLTPAQHKHAFVSPPAGIACAPTSPPPTASSSSTPR